jgi:hypothetical protein
LIAAVLAASLAYFMLAGDPESGDGLTFGEVGATAEADAGEVVEHAVAPEERERTAIAEHGSAAVVVRGTVTGIDALPIAGARVVVSHPYLTSTRATTDAEGRFAIEVEEPRGELRLEGDEWVLLGGELQLYEGALDGYRLIVAAPTRLAGRVVDAEGSPLAGAEVHAMAPLDALVPFGVVSRPLEHAGQSGRTDAEGRFSLAFVPKVADLAVRATLEGHEPAEVSVADPYPREVVIRLRSLR